jgi:hypothetical protein
MKVIFSESITSRALTSMVVLAPLGNDVVVSIAGNPAVDAKFPLPLVVRGLRLGRDGREPEQADGEQAVRKSGVDALPHR